MSRQRTKSAKRRGNAQAKAALRAAALPWWQSLEEGGAARYLLPAVLLIVALVHASALGTFFAQDDVTFLARARGISPTPWSFARPLSEGFTWRMLEALFGLTPLPYRLFTFALHLSSTAFVYWIGRRLLESRVAAAAAAILFGASSIAFTPLHWTSSLVELMACFFTLAAFHVHLVGRERGSAGLQWLSAGLVLAALLSKENTILFPLVLLVAHVRLGGSSTRSIVPQTIVTVAYAAAFVATIGLVHYVGSEVYSMTASPMFLAHNLATYLRWSVALWVPIRDASAAVDPHAWVIGLPVAIVLVLVLVAQRNAQRHPEEVGMVWFLAMLAPVVPLLFHSYLYYLYVPWPGLCWTVAAIGQRMTSVRPRLVRHALAALLAAFVFVEASNVRARESAMIGPFPADKTVRESLMLRNVVHDLRAAHLGTGDQVAFVNPAPQRHFSTSGSEASQPVASYVPLAGTMRDGETLELFFPGVQYLGFSDTLPRAWEKAQVFLYQDEGTARHLGAGSHALAELGTFAIKMGDWNLAERFFHRSLALGDTLPDATFGLIITSDFLGKRQRAVGYANDFLRRWPNHKLAAQVRSALANIGAARSPEEVPVVTPPAPPATRAP